MTTDAPQNRRENGTFGPGNKANPGGRPKGLAAKVRELVPAEQLTEFMLAVLNGDESALGEAPKVKDRMDAAQWLADRGYGKAASFAPVEDGDPLELNDIEREIARLGDELAARRTTKTAGPAKAGGVAGNGQNGAATA